MESVRFETNFISVQMTSNQLVENSGKLNLYLKYNIFVKCSRKIFTGILHVLSIVTIQKFVSIFDIRKLCVLVPIGKPDEFICFSDLMIVA